MEKFTTFNIKKGDTKKIKNCIKKGQFSCIEQICKIELPLNKVRMNGINQQPKTATWLSILPLSEKDETFNKQ